MNKFVAGVAGVVALVSVAAPVASADPVPNFVVGTPERDLLVGTRHRDFILGRSGNDWLIGGRASDVLRGGFGNDVLRDFRPVGHSGEDFFRGGPGVDRCVGSSEDHFVGCEVVVIR